MAVLPYSDPQYINTLDYQLPYSDPQFIATAPIQEEWYLPDGSLNLVPGTLFAPP